MAADGPLPEPARPGTDDEGPVPEGAEPGDVRAALGEYIRDQRRQTRMSMRKLAELAGVSNPYLSQIERGLRKPSADILQQLARALSVSAETLYVQAGILEQRGGGVDVIGEIQRDLHLTAEHRETLIRIYRSFRAEAGQPVGDAERVDNDSRENRSSGSELIEGEGC